MKHYRYEVSKKMEIAGAHNLDLPYESKCKNLHGHNWLVTVYVGANELENDMVIDFAHLKKEIHGRLDHAYINKVVNVNPTAENIGRWIADTINKIRSDAHCFRVDVQESEGNIAIYRDIEE